MNTTAASFSIPRSQESDHSTWRQFFSASEKVWEKYHDVIHPSYLDHIDVLYRFRDRVPSLSELNETLSDIGWQAQYVDGYAPGWQVARELLYKKIMPISRYLRSPKEVYFGKEPDFIHDVFGHLPLLFSEEYCQTLAHWAQSSFDSPIQEADKIAYRINKMIVTEEDGSGAPGLVSLKAAAQAMSSYFDTNPSGFYLFDKLYFWGFEFGIMKDESDVKIIGAGILSSLHEIKRIATERLNFEKLSLQTLNANVNISTLQDSYLYMENFLDLVNVVDQISGSIVNSSEAISAFDK